MEKIFFNRASIVAALLLLATGCSWLVFEQRSESFYASLIIILITLVKVRAILYSFMELSHQELAWRVAFNIWLFIVASTLLIGSYSSFHAF